MTMFELALAIGGPIIGLASVLYYRRQTLAAEGPKEPDLSLLEMSWEKDDWLKLTIVTTNRTDRSWKMVSAMATIPVGAKIISQYQRQNLGAPYDPCWADLDTIDTSKLTNTAKPMSSVAPFETRTDQTYIGSNYQCREDFYVYLPSILRSESISIALTLEDNAMITRQISTLLYRKLPTSEARPIN